MKLHNKLTLPPVGMRIIKSAIGVLIGFIIYLLRGKVGAPFYTALSVLWCIQPNNKDAKIKALQRTIGTFIGAFYGLIVILLELYVIDFSIDIYRYIFISLSLILVLYTTVLLNKKNASYFSCVVFLSIVVLHIMDENPYYFVMNRVLDTLIGIGIALVINLIELPRKKKKNILFVSELDDALLNIDDKINSFSRFELNRMLEDGINFTIATMRTPAAVIDAVRGINLNLPVVVMDGAALYDVTKKRFIKVFDIEHKEVDALVDFMHERKFHCFINAVLEDFLVIFYGDFNNLVEEDIYSSLRSSPYRNYLKRKLPKDYNAVYLMLIDTEARMKGLYKELKSNGFVDKYKILMYPSKNYEGYMYIKIYNKLSNKERMIREIQKLSLTDDVIYFGDIATENNIYYKESPSSWAVNELKHLYSPFIWQK